MAPSLISKGQTSDRFVADRVRHIPRVGSRAIDAKVENLRAGGAEVIATTPYPSVPLPPHIMEVAKRAARESINPPSRGLRELRNAIATMLSSELSLTINPASDVLVTGGGMHALYLIFATLLDSGDEVLVPSPCYFLEGLIKPLGATIVDVPMKEEDDYGWDIELLEAKVSDRTKLMFLNTPVNPTGRVLTIHDLQRIAAIANERDMLVVSDESYDKLIYDGLRHVSIMSLEGMRERTIVVRSFTKSYAMPNWRIGYIVACEDLVNYLIQTLEWMVLYGNYVSQKVAEAALTGPQEWLAEGALQLEINRNLIHEGMKRISGISCLKPQGGPFIFPNVARLKGTCDEICDVLVREFGISSVPGRFFGADDHLRIAFGGPKQLIELFLERVEQAVQQIGFG